MPLYDSKGAYTCHRFNNWNQAVNELFGNAEEIAEKTNLEKQEIQEKKANGEHKDLAHQILGNIDEHFVLKPSDQQIVLQELTKVTP